MIIPYDAVQGYSLVQQQVTVAALKALYELFAAVTNRDDRIAAFPEVMGPYAESAAYLSAGFYDELRDMQEVKGSFSADLAPAPEKAAWYALAGWGTSGSVFERGGSVLAYSLVSGGLTRMLTEAASDTMIGNAAIDRGTVGYQRVPSPGCCAFCGLLASRSAGYSSATSAGEVVGRGTPVSKGGRGKGIKARGSQRAGESFHDDCKCKIVAVHSGNSVQMQSDADKYYDAYAESRERVADKRRADGYKGFGDQAESQKLILADMRSVLNVK